MFASWQPRYADAGIATFPVRDKRPAVKGYLKLGQAVSRRLASKFPDAEEFGFSCKPSRITVLDVDAPDERVLAAALDEFGPTPVLVRSGSGNFQAWYRHDGEGRLIRPRPDRPIDILGAGYVVAPPSRSTRGTYEWINGSLEDLPFLPTMRPSMFGPEACRRGAAAVPKIRDGQRNQTLWRECMKSARSCSDAEELFQLASRTNEDGCYNPLNESEVRRIVASAWNLEVSGQNWFGSGRRVVVKHEDIDCLMAKDPDAFLLMTLLKRHHWGRDFVVANAMHQIMPGGGWRRERFTAARARLEDLGEIVMVKPHNGRSPAVYRFKSAQN